MDIFNVVAGVASIISLLVAVLSIRSQQIARNRENQNIVLYQAKLRDLRTTLRGAATNVELLIRRADEDEVNAAELQNLGRMVRTSLVTAIIATSEFGTRLRQWKFGQLLDTRQIEGGGPETLDGQSDGGE